jgi:transposase
MMGYQPKVQNQLFYTNFNLSQRIRQDHILRKINTHIDFNFIYNEVKDKYGIKGNVSVPPPIILKMMLLLIFYNVRSERELILTIPERLDWIWFLGYDIDDEIPNHSVLSKARNRWGADAFKTFFENIIWQCVEAGLIDGSKLFMDSSMVQADASNNSVVNKESLKRYLNKSYLILESRLEEEHQSEESDDIPKSGIANKKYISTTDPDASVSRRGKGSSKLQYQIHRGVDPKHEIITAAEVTPGEVNEAHRMQSLINSHQNNTGKTVDTVVADNKYGTIDNYLACYQRGIKSHFNSLEQTQQGAGKYEDIFPKEDFIYDAERDVFICPSGKILKRRKLYKKRNHYEYIASAGTCKICQLRRKCTKSKTSRTLKRHIQQEELDIMLDQATSKEAQKDIRTRQHLMERSFARATRYGYQRSRWRRLWRVQIQEYLISTIQNIMVLIGNIKEQPPELAVAYAKPERETRVVSLNTNSRFNNCFFYIVIDIFDAFCSSYLRKLFNNRNFKPAVNFL